MMNNSNRVDRVAEEAVARHLQTDHAGHARSRMQSDAQLQLVVRPVADAERGDRLQQPQRHACDFASVARAIPHR